MDGYLTLSLQGDHYAMGWQHGRQVRALRPEIVRGLAARWREAQPCRSEARFEVLFEETRALMARIDRPGLDLMRGQADALGVGVETLLRCNLAGALMDARSVRRHLDNEGCTTWAAAGSATAGGQPILAKNRDSSLEHLRLQCLVRARPAVGYRYLYITSAGSPGVFCAGLNQAGLAVADTHVTSTDLGPGLPDHSLMMHVLERHDSVSSAVDYLRAVPRMGRHNLLLADARGSLAVFEIGHHGYGLREARDGVLVNTNHFASPEMEASFVDVSEPEQRGSSQQRFARATRELEVALGSIDIDLAQRLMAGHVGPLASICCHPKGEDGSRTISTSIFLPAERRMLFCHGLPCQGQFEAFAV
ncbi:MAG TPA: C45 family peptidase [Anaerolineae bacterium]|nr:C45 family peptidase [Anaerolineae bacterium]